MSSIKGLHQLFPEVYLLIRQQTVNENYSPKREILSSFFASSSMNEMEEDEDEDEKRHRKVNKKKSPEKKDEKETR